MDHIDKVMGKFRIEAEALRMLRHPNICFFFDACLMRGTPGIVLELIEGGNLGSYLGLDSRSDFYFLLLISEDWQIQQQSVFAHNTPGGPLQLNKKI